MSNRDRGNWNEERVELLKKLWRLGLSASACEARIGVPGITRSAVIGKVHRLGLAGRAESANQRSKSASKTRKKREQQQPPNVKAMISKVRIPPTPYVERVEDVVVVEEKNRRGIVYLLDNQCRFPINDTKAADFHFCDLDKVLGKSYCEYHCRVAYPVPEPRRDYAQLPIVQEVEKTPETV